MKFVSVRELRNNPGAVWAELREQDLVLTFNGKPVGILLSTDEEEFGEALESVRRVRAMQAVSRMRRHVAHQHPRPSRPFSDPGSAQPLPKR